MHYLAWAPLRKQIQSVLHFTGISTMPRPFASGSRQAPDPYDQFLEQRGFYRKHTARDSSCLFRSISEQMYDTQLHHLIIRQRCVDYMRKCKSLFQKVIVFLMHFFGEK